MQRTATPIRAELERELKTDAQRQRRAQLTAAQRDETREANRLQRAQHRDQLSFTEREEAREANRLQHIPSGLERTTCPRDFFWATWRRRLGPRQVMHPELLRR